MMRTLPQIIYLNGPSSSGKTTLAKALQDAFGEPYLCIGIDKVIGWMPEKVNDWTGGEAALGYSWKQGKDASGHPTQELCVGPYAEKIAKTYQEIVLMLAKMGLHLIIDDISFGRKETEKWKEMLKEFSVLWVGVNAPLSILEERERARGDRIIGSARGQFHRVHVDAAYDLEIDTHHSTLSENVEKIMFLSTYRARQPCDNRTVLVRPLEVTDITQIVERFSFPWSSPEKTRALWNVYFQEQNEGIRTVALLEKDHEILGYGSLLRKPECPFFDDKNIPEINALWIDEKHRGQGFGTVLIKWIEDLAAHEGYHEIGIGVGLYRDYGQAQRLYFRLGYRPEGNGITYQGQPAVAGRSYPLDDDLILWMVKGLDR